jgi:hypothetical protein
VRQYCIPRGSCFQSANDHRQVRDLQFSPDDVLKHLLVEAQVRQQPLQPASSLLATLTCPVSSVCFAQLSEGWRPQSGSFGDGLGQPEERNEAAMADEDRTIPATLNNVIKIDDERIRGHLDRVVRGTVEETLNALLDAGADRLCNAHDLPPLNALVRD